VIAVASEQTDPGGVRFALRDTVLDGDPRAIKPGVPVSVLYRLVGERWPVAIEVRMHVNSTSK